MTVLLNQVLMIYQEVVYRTLRRRAQLREVWQGLKDGRARGAHTYVQAGTYTATLAAMDNAGALASCKITILAIDPNVINAPSSLTAGVSGKTVTLRWLDNASNETGYYVERGVKTSKTGTVYTRIATLAANASSYSETVASGTYYYRVQAFNSTTGRQSPYSSAVSVRIR